MVKIAALLPGQMSDMQGLDRGLGPQQTQWQIVHNLSHQSAAVRTLWSSSSLAAGCVAWSQVASILLWILLFASHCQRFPLLYYMALVIRRAVQAAVVTEIYTKDSGADFHFFPSFSALVDWSKGLLQSKVSRCWIRMAHRQDSHLFFFALYYPNFIYVLLVLPLLLL